MELLAKLFPGEEPLRIPSDRMLWRQIPGERAFDKVEGGDLTPILNSLPDALVLFDTESKTKIFNKTAVKYLGGKPLENCGLFHPDRVTPVSEENRPLQRALAGEHVEPMELVLRTPVYPDGVFVEISAAPIIDGWGKVHGAVALIRDLTKRKIVEEQLRHSNLRLETLSQMVNDYIWEWDLVNDKGWRQGRKNAYGYAEEEIHSVDRWWREKIHPDDQERIFALHRDLMDGRKDSYRAEHRWRKGDGTYAHIIGQAHVIARDENHRPTYIMGASLDITERKKSEEKLAQLALILESTDDAVFSVGLDRRITSWNKGAEKLWGYTAQEIIGCDSGVLGDLSEAAAKNVKPRLLNGESIQRFEMWRQKKNGEKMLLSHTVSPIRDAKDEIIGFSIIGRDITDVRKAEEEILRLTSNLERSNRELTEFAFLASHDISEPLRTMSSFAHLIKKEYAGRLDDRGKEFVDFILDGASRLRRLIDSLLKYARFEGASLNIQEVDCNRLVERIKSDLQIAIENSRAELTVAPLPTIRGDEVQLGQLFQNLISNALKFFRDGHPKVTLSAKREGNEWIFSVADQGIGIDPRYHGRIFQAFQRLNSREEFQGSGLGLASCKRIIDRHGGQIWFESAANRGTTFYFSIPDGLDN